MEIRSNCDHAGPDVLLGRAETQMLLRATTRAPSLHDAQPSGFAVGPRHVELYADASRQLRNADPTGRSLLVSCGCALFNLRVAAEHLGFHPRVPSPTARTRRWTRSPRSTIGMRIRAVSVVTTRRYPSGGRTGDRSPPRSSPVRCSRPLARRPRRGGRVEGLLAHRGQPYPPRDSDSIGHRASVISLLGVAASATSPPVRSGPCRTTRSAPWVGARRAVRPWVLVRLRRGPHVTAAHSPERYCNISRDRSPSRRPDAVRRDLGIT